MGASSSILRTQELTEFRKLNTSIENIEIPARPESRSVTDKKGFLFFGIPIIIFLGFFIYSLVHSDFLRYSYDYDNCGNMCGLNNPKVPDIPCSGADYTSMIWSTNSSDGTKRCVQSCPRGTEETYMPRVCEKRMEPNRIRRSLDFEDNRDDNFMDTLNALRGEWWKFIVVILITIVLSLIMLYLMRFTTAIVVWGVLIFSLIIAIGATAGLWYAYFKTPDDERPPVLIIAAVFTIFTVVIILLFICLFKKIQLVIQLLKEATKAVFAMPLLILVPVVTTLLQFCVLGAFGASTVWLLTSRELRKYSDTHYEYEMNGIMAFTLAFNFIMTSWTMQFIAGFQYMTIAGSIASWFFSKNKQYLGSPISTSFLNAVKFHTGTIAFGSFIIILMAIVKALIRSLVDNEKLRCILECCCSNIEAFLKFLSKNAYIETAIHGQSFLRSGRRAAKLLLTNAASVIAINSVGDFVLGMIEFIIVIISTGIAVILFKNLSHFWVPALICFIVSVVIVAIVFGIFNTTIDSLFICFCEDKTINDGMSRPYYMSRGLMEFIENSKKFYGDKGN